MNVQKELEDLGITDVRGAIEKAFISGFNFSAEGYNGEHNEYIENELDAAANDYIVVLIRNNK